MTSPARTCELVVIGASLGGTVALERILGGLPGDLPTPIAVVLHRHVHSDETLLRALQRPSALPVREAEDKQPIGPGVFVAPPDYHLLVERGWFNLSLEGPVSHARPSIDVLFESAADAYGPGVLGVVLTGANHDGAAGVARILKEGGRVLAQDPDTAEAPQMPRAAIEAGADPVLSLEEITAQLAALAGDSS